MYYNIREVLPYKRSTTNYNIREVLQYKRSLLQYMRGTYYSKLVILYFYHKNNSNKANYLTIIHDNWISLYYTDLDCTQ